MPLFTTTTVSGLTDRIAKIASALETTLSTARQATGPGGLFQRVTATNDYQVERDLITPTYDFEQNLSGLTLFAGSQLTVGLINGLETHCSRTANVSFNTYLRNSGLQVSEYYAQVHGAVRGTQLQAHNVFAESNIVMASFTKVGLANWTFAAGQNLGSGGTSLYDSVTPNTGEQKLLFSGLGLSGPVTLTFNVSGLDDAGSVQQYRATLSASPSMTVLNTTTKMRTITSVSYVSGDISGNATGAVLQLINSRERVVTY